ncbi:MAG: DoxX family protein [Trueperaceae bacterium]
MVSEQIRSPALRSAGAAIGLAAHAHWLPRIGIASIFLFHGITKFPQAAELSQMMNMPAALIVMLGMMEIVGGALILAGGLARAWVTQAGAAILAMVMAGAVGTVHWGQWAFTASPTHPMGGMEFQVFMILVLVWLALSAPRARVGVRAY